VNESFSLFDDLLKLCADFGYSVWDQFWDWFGLAMLFWWLWKFEQRGS